MSTKIEHTDEEYLEAISQGVMAVPGVSGKGHAAIEVAQSVLKWLRQRGLVPKPTPREVIIKTLVNQSGKGYSEFDQGRANYLAGWIIEALHHAGYEITD